jgi:hypothetical protein
LLEHFALEYAANLDDHHQKEYMHEHFNISPEEAKRAKWPHEIFLINLIVNHVFVFLATVSVASTFPLVPLLIPIISCCIIGYLLVKSKQVAASNETWFVKSHWQICARRNRFFLILLAVPMSVTALGLSLAKMFGWSKIPTLALIGGVGLLPFMVSLLVLIVLGNESVHLARSGNLPKRFVELNPNPQTASSQQSNSNG